MQVNLTSIPTSTTAAFPSRLSVNASTCRLCIFKVEENDLFGLLFLFDWSHLSVKSDI